MTDTQRLRSVTVPLTHRIDFNWPDPIIEAAPRKRKAKKRVAKYKKKVGGEVVLREKDAA